MALYSLFAKYFREVAKQTSTFQMAAYSLFAKYFCEFAKQTSTFQMALYSLFAKYFLYSRVCEANEHVLNGYTVYS